MRWWVLSNFIINHFGNHNGKHFTIYVSQGILLYTLNLHHVTCELCLNKNGKDK